MTSKRFFKVIACTIISLAIILTRYAYITSQTKYDIDTREKKVLRLSKISNPRTSPKPKHIKPALDLKIDSEKNKPIEPKVESEVITADNMESHDNTQAQSNESQDNTQLQSNEFGSHGRLEIPTLGISVPLWDSYLHTAQQFVDADNSAAYVTDYCNGLIADHYNQGFEAIKVAKPGVDIAKLVYPDGYVEEFLCSSVDPNGYNYGYLWTVADYSTGETWYEGGIVDSEGMHLSIYNDSKYIVTYTCNQDYHHITIVVWERI